jgi:autotransporter-associated beta strand protein
MKIVHEAGTAQKKHRRKAPGFRSLSLPVLMGVILFSSFSGNVSAQTNSQQIYLQCLTNFESYAETVWHTNTVGIPDAGYWGDGGGQSGNNGGIRGNSGIAVAYAVLCVALPNDPKFTSRLARVRQALNYDYNTHFTGGYNTTSGSQWGWNGASTDWQTPEWSGSMGLTCILVQSNLPAATVAGVRTVVVSEADHRASIAPASGYVYDTKAEENAWQGNILALAAAWMSTSNNAPTWLTTAKSYFVNTYTVPNTNGDPLAVWVTTQTLYPSFALQNHYFYHPTYEMVAGMSSGDSLLMARLANTNVAAQLQAYAEHNVMAVWTNNLNLLVMDNGDFAYPASVDWSVRDFEHNSFMAWMAAHFNDPLARWADDKLSQCVRYHQIVNGDGTFVGVSATPGSGAIIFYREAVEARRTAIAWLHWNYADYPTGTMTAPTNALMNNTDVQVIHQRSAFGNFSVSYNVNSSRNSIMAMIEPASLSVPTNAFIASPRLPGVLGLGALGNPTAATLVSFSTNATGFDAEFKLTSSLGTTEEFIKSTGESFALIEVPALNSGSTASSGGSFICGIENDPLTGGSRLLEWTNNSATMTALSGTSRNITNNWICISGRYGLAAGPAGYFHYAATNGYRRVSYTVSEAGEAEDTLSFVENNQLAPRYAVWFPAKSALQTSNLTAQISWVTNNSTATLTFPGAGGAATTLSAFIGVSPTNNNGAWNVDASGNWSGTGNWSSAIVADGTSYTADFSTVNITANRMVTLDTSRNIGTLKFGDPSGVRNWIVTNSSASVLTLNNGSTSPAIVVTNTATLALPVAGTNGFTKSGPGTLILSGSNSLSGTLNVDTAQPSTGNDGVVRLASSTATGSVSAINIRNQNSASSTLQFDGSAGDISSSAIVTLNGRNTNVIAIQNLSGSNTLAGNFILGSGGGNYWLDSDSGTLNLSGLIPASAPTVPNARTLTFMGAGNILVSGIISNANGFTVSVNKTNTGTLTLNGVNTYTGSTIVTGGTLSGAGTIAGPVTITPSAILSPGSGSIGSLTINSALTNNGTVSVRLNKAGAALTNDNVKGVSTLAYGGALQLVSTGDQITVSNSFKIFYATNYRNFFSSIVPATPGTNLLWNTNNLAVNGTLAVALGTVKPQVGSLFLAGTNLVLTGGGGAAGYGFSILTSTNLAAPLAGWSLAETGVCDSNGNFTVTNGLSAGNLWQFYVVRIP